MQQELFKKAVEDRVSHDLIERELNVSMASIRNWIAAGYLTLTQSGLIDRNSYLDFKENVVGKLKLNKRANKLHLDDTKKTQIHASLIERIDAVYDGGASEGLSADYENALGVSYKNSEGIFYTPAEIVEYLFDTAGVGTSDLVFLDPCCGTGNFLLQALDVGFLPQNIYGFDTDETAVEIAKARFFEASGQKTNNIENRDFLTAIIGGDSEQFADVILTNPPWGKKFDTTTKKSYSELLNGGTKIDSSGLFTQACLKALKNDGKLGLLLPEAFFNIAAFETVRHALSKYQILSVTDHGKPFKGLQTRAQSIVIKKTNVSNTHKVVCRVGEVATHRRQSDFSQNPKAIFNFQVTANEAEIVKYLYAMPHLLLKDNADWALGIVTGNNKKHVSRESANGLVPVYKGSDFMKGEVKSPTNFIDPDLSKYQQVAPEKMYLASEKLVYRFINNDLVFHYDTEQKYVLNSANIMIPHDEFPIGAKEICFLLNTGLMNWLFQSIFHTHKILRSDIEALPIFAGYFSAGGEMTEDGFLDYLQLEKKLDGTFRVKS